MELNNVKVNYNNSIRIEGSKVVYFDPYEIKDELHDADYIFCTHSHYDHFSEKDIRKVMNENTKIITVISSKVDAENIVGDNNVMIVEPGNKYIIEELYFETTYAYNVDKQFHPKENCWVGFIVDLDGVRYFISGDTDYIDEIKNVRADVAFIPVGGTYTMNYEEASELANVMRVQVIVPTHYGCVSGEREDGEKFKFLVDDKDVQLLLFKN